MPFVAAALALLVAGIAAVAVPPYLRNVRRELSRAGWMEQVAGSLGFAFSRTDPAYPGASAMRFPFELFSRGIEQTCENVMTGVIDRVAVTAFDFNYVSNIDSDGDPDNDTRSEPVLYSCALATVPGHRPPRRDRAGIGAALVTRGRRAGEARVGHLQRAVQGGLAGAQLRDRPL